MEYEATWRPQPRQEIALASPADELFFGGAAGGGKSDFLLVDFTRGLPYGAAHRGIIFRKTYKELEELINRSYALFLPMGANYMRTEKTWRFPGGATFKFRHLETDQDAHHYQGHQYSWIGWDELTNWKTDYVYMMLMSRLRSPEGIPVCIRAAGNPGGVGHAWVKGRFIDGKEPMYIYRDPILDTTIQFIPSKLEDNQILMKNDPGYEKRLEILPEHLKRAYRHGDWDIFFGQVFEEWRREQHVIKPFPLEPSWKKYTSMDWGYAKPFSIGWWAITGEGRAIRYREWYGGDKFKRNTGIRMGAKQVAERALELSQAEGVNQMVADPAVWSKIDDTPSIAEIFQGVGWQMEKANNDRLSGVARFHDLLQTTGWDGKPMMLVFSTCHDFIRTIPLLVYDEKHPEDVDTTQEDHSYDEARYGIMHRTAKHTREMPKPMARNPAQSAMNYRPF